MTILIFIVSLLGAIAIGVLSPGIITVRHFIDVLDGYL